MVGASHLASFTSYFMKGQLLDLFLNPIPIVAGTWKTILDFRLFLLAPFQEKKFSWRYDFGWHRGSKGTFKKKHYGSLALSFWGAEI